MADIILDFRYALRTLAARPGFARVVVLTLALAVGANTAVFTMVHAMILRPVPHVQEAERLVSLSMAQPRLGIERGDLGLADFLDFRAACESCESMAIFEDQSIVLQHGDEAERLEGLVASYNLFDLLGVRPHVGRSFLPEEGVEGGDAVALLSYGLWQRRFGLDPKIVGKAVLINGSPRVVIGVLPEGFRFPATSDVWLPLTATSEEDRSERTWDGTLARLAPGASREQAEAELATLAAGLAERHPDTNAGWSVHLIPFRRAMIDPGLERALALFQAAVFLVLLIACANVANLLLAREVSRQREVALRLALGAGRFRVVRQLLTESLVLAVLGGALGVLIARWSLDWLLHANPEEWPFWLDFSMSWPVLVATLVISVLAGLLFGLIPALRAARPELTGTLKEGGSQATGSRSRQRLQRILVGGEVAVAVVLLFGSLLLVRSFMAVAGADVGFETERMLVLRTYLPGEAYDTPESRIAALDAAVERVEALPGVVAATFTGAVPADDGSGRVVFKPEGQTFERDELPMGTYIGSTAGFFRALEVPLYSGRSFTTEEGRDPDAKVAVVNRTLAERFWPGGQAIGKRLSFGQGEEARELTVVGVVGDLQYEELGEETMADRLQIHLPYALTTWRSAALMVRTQADPAALAPLVREEIRAFDPALPVWDLRTMPEVLRYTSWGQRILSEIFAYFGFIALVLGALGIYGVMSYTVSQRVHEIGIRMALGASREQVVRRIVESGLWVSGIGWLVGIAGALAAARLMGSLLWGVGPWDGASLLLVSVIILVVSLLASYVPARKAAKIEPSQALRAD